MTSKTADEIRAYFKTPAGKKELAQTTRRLQAMKDSQIDFSDIPPLSEKQLARMVRRAKNDERQKGKLMLTPQERQRIEDEEKRRYHEEAYRAKVQRELREEPPERPKRFIHAFTASMITLILISAGLSQTSLPLSASMLIAIVLAAVVGKKVL